MNVIIMAVVAMANCATVDIQGEIDRVAAQGGGTVVVEKGEWLARPFVLRSNVTLRLDEGSVLYASTNVYDYAAMTRGNRYFIFAEGATNAAIVGKGTLNGNGWAFRESRRIPGESQPQDLPVMMRFSRCRGLRLEGFTYRDCGAWGLHLRNCDGVVVRNLTCFSHSNRTNDGIDIESSNVLVEGCDFDTGDDAVVFKTESDKTFPVTNVVIRNCRIASRCNGVKFGTGSYCDVRDITIENCELYRATPHPGGSSRRIFPGVTEDASGLAGLALEVVDGGRLENVTIRGIDIRGFMVPVFVRLGRRREPLDPVRGTYLRNVLIEKVKGTADSRIANSITGVPGLRPSGITLRDVELVCRGGGTKADAARPVPEMERSYPECTMFHPGWPDHLVHSELTLPAWGFYLRHADDIRFENVRLVLANPDERERIVTDDVLNLRLDAHGGVAAVPDTEKLFRTYIRRFNEKDDELYTNAIPNSAAEEFLVANCPRFACPDRDLERTFAFRWWTFRKHLRHDLGHWTVTEFLPKVSWSGKDNTIVCPAGHHLREGRWLRDTRIIEEYARFWLADPEAKHRWLYSSWLYTGTKLFAEVSGREELLEELLDAAVAYYEGWEHSGKAMGGDGKGGFFSLDGNEGTEISLGGNGYKPLFSSAMWSEAKTIAEVAGKLGRKDLAERFAAKAEAVRKSIFDNCWNPEVGFFTTRPSRGKPKGTVRELHGYAPWYFGMPTEDRSPDWGQLVDPQGFAATFGLTFPERRAKGFTIDYAGHECKWNGPSWPFATSIALTALANWLHGEGWKGENVEGWKGAEVERSSFNSLLHQYAAQQVLVKPNGEVVPWIDENLHPDKREWLARKIILDNEKMRRRFPAERGKDYNHSTFCDLVISGLVGFLPEGEKGFAVDPLLPADWDYMVLDNLRYRGHEVAIRWQRGKGLEVTVDGRVAAHRATLGKLSVANVNR